MVPRKSRGVVVTSGAAAASAMRGSVARRGSCAGCAAHVARIGEASTGRRSATGEKAAAAPTADRSTIERIVIYLETEPQALGAPPSSLGG